MQERYWKLMSQKKYDLIYLNKHFHEYVIIDRVLSIALAIFSCTSIGAWTIWKAYAFLWGSIIAISQVISVVNDYLPYKKRIAEIAELSGKLVPLYNSIEYQWLSVSNGSLTEVEVNELINDYKTKWSELENKYLLSDSLPPKKRIIKQAEAEKEHYFQLNF